jgi:hypothetical protein
MLEIFTFFYYFLYGYFNCRLLDKASVIIYNKLNNNTPYSQNVRWFFIHWIINCYITIMGFPNIIFSLQNIAECSTTKWINGYETYGVAIALHFYHIFNFKLTKTDWIHHIVTAIITGPIILLTNTTCVSAIGLWFASGLPGAIDYFLLWLVKMGYCNKKLEKVVYVIISSWVRAPGCIYTVTLQLGSLVHLQQLSYIQIIGRFWMSLVIYWNGIFFMNLTLRDYYSRSKE